jgi:hypothetical protein
METLPTEIMSRRGDETIHEIKLRITELRNVYLEKINESLKNEPENYRISFREFKSLASGNPELYSGNFKPWLLILLIKFRYYAMRHGEKDYVMSHDYVKAMEYLRLHSKQGYENATQKTMDRISLARSVMAQLSQEKRDYKHGDGDGEKLQRYENFSKKFLAFNPDISKYIDRLSYSMNQTH